MKYKRIMITVLVIAFLISTFTFAAGNKATIEVLFNAVNLMVNGEKVDAETIVYNGTTYVPIRAAAEMLGKEVSWDQQTSTASINDKIEDDKPAGVTPIYVEDLPLKIHSITTDSIGTTWMKATYTNNSPYAITGYNLTVLLKDKNDKTYLINYDTVLPGETSPVFETFGPGSKKMDDVQFLKLVITAKKQDGSNIRVEYDYKLNEYESYEYDR